MWTRPKRVVLKIRISRFFRRMYRKIKCKIAGVDDVNQYDDIFGDAPVTEVCPNRGKKIKSTLVVAVSSLAIGVSQAATVSTKHGVPMSRNSILVFGVTVMAASSYVWFNYMNAANDGVTEEDIDFMFDLANNTSFGKFEDSKDGMKVFDVLHALTTGNFDEFDSEENELDKEFFIGTEGSDDDDNDDEDNPKSKEDEEDEEVIRENAKLFSAKISFSDDEDDDDEDEIITRTPREETVRTKFGTTPRISKGMGKPAFSKPKKKISLIPSSSIYDDMDDDDKEQPDSWMDF